MKNRFYAYIQKLQDTITAKLEEVDGKAKFHEDIWKREEGGGGRTRVIENGAIFEKRWRKYFCSLRSTGSSHAAIF